MLRFDYSKSPNNENYTIRVVSEEKDKSSNCGYLVLGEKEWAELNYSCHLNNQLRRDASKEPFFKFVDKSNGTS